MLKRISSLILVLIVCGSVLAGTARVRDEHLCEMGGMEAMPGMSEMPCCKEHEIQPSLSEPILPDQCCITLPPPTGSSGAKFNLKPPAFGIGMIHPAIAQLPVSAPKTYSCARSPGVFLPNLQATYIRNLAILI